MPKTRITVNISQERAISLLSGYLDAMVTVSRMRSAAVMESLGMSEQEIYNLTKQRDSLLDEFKEETLKKLCSICLIRTTSMPLVGERSDERCCSHTPWARVSRHSFLYGQAYDRDDAKS
jgi:hypothetical protein